MGRAIEMQRVACIAFITWQLPFVSVVSNKKKQQAEKWYTFSQHDILLERNETNQF
jgi:hypothetical protein